MKHTYDNWYTRKRAELTKICESRKNKSDIGEDILDELMRELTDHAVKTLPDKTAQAHRTWTNSNPGRPGFNNSNPGLGVAAPRNWEPRTYRGNFT
ncbi:hypothetical protein NHQ30_000226 [Ciborinia camelliae]|nr:hypothetical protein NHQ30_000226 [Ciborinia camelliae]